MSKINFRLYGDQIYGLSSKYFQEYINPEIKKEEFLTSFKNGLIDINITGIKKQINILPQLIIKDLKAEKIIINIPDENSNLALKISKLKLMLVVKELTEEEILSLLINKRQKLIKKFIKEAIKSIERNDSISIVNDLNAEDEEKNIELKKLTTDFNKMIQQLKDFEKSIVIKPKINPKSKTKSDTEIKREIKIAEAQIKIDEDNDNIKKNEEKNDDIELESENKNLIDDKESKKDNNKKEENVEKKSEIDEGFDIKSHSSRIKKINIKKGNDDSKELPDLGKINIEHYRDSISQMDEKDIKSPKNNMTSAHQNKTINLIRLNKKEGTNFNNAKTNQNGIGATQSNTGGIISQTNYDKNK